jgi:long-chain acyl-CoA synthetase
MSMRTLAELFLSTAAQDKSEHLLHKVDGEYQPVPTEELADKVRRTAKALQDLGLDPGDRVALMADNGPHWPIIDFATLTSGAVTVPIYPTLLPDQAVYIAQDSGAKVIFAHHEHQLEGFLSHAEELPEGVRFVLIEGKSEDERVLTLAEIYERGAGYDTALLDEKAKAVAADDLASLVYTSGTTGKPKGVMLTHDNFVSNIHGGLTLLDLDSSFTALSFLPLSHVFERTIDYCYFWRGLTIAYAESVQTVAQNFQEVRPHTFVSVPRVYEKVLAKVHEGVAAGSPLKQKIFQWAVDVARQALPYRLRNDHPPGWLGLKLALADGLVFSKIRERLGGRFQFAFSGGAPLGREVAEFFWGAGIPVFEGYGLTETSPVVTGNAPGAVKLGTVGRAIPDVTVEIASDGEILVRGPNVMKGYFNQPEATAEAIDPEGWFHTGDIGEVDEDGYLRITDRKKELIVNAYGKNIAPAPIENALKASRFIGQAVVIGDRRKFLSALLVPDFEVLVPWAKGHSLETSDMGQLLETEEVRGLFEAEVQTVNRSLAKYEQVQVWRLLDRELTLETGELTPTQKIKRRVVHEKFADVIDSMYPPE